MFDKLSHSGKRMMNFIKIAITGALVGLTGVTLFTAFKILTEI